MVNFKLWNTITGWFVFLIAATVYLLTLEPTVSYWDCGEFIASAYKLEVNHPPGSPLFLMLAKVASLFAADKSRVALMINAMSAIASAFTILFLFWTITHLARRLYLKNNTLTTGTLVMLLGSGFVGSLAFSFTDTFWFSAVEAEVYATSSLFTAFVFWAILKWEEQCDASFANRWIVLIAFLIGLSIGVHLLNLLAIPSIVLIIYFKKFKTTVGGFIVAIVLSMVLLAFVLFGIISGIPVLASRAEIWCVNSMHMPFHTGLIGFLFLLVIFITGGLWVTWRMNRPALNTGFLCLAMILAGYSSYSVVVIRSQANPPLNENQPDNVLTFTDYINRDEFGDTPLLYGPWFNAPITGINEGKPVYRREHNQYVIAYHKSAYSFDRNFMTLFPRMYSRDNSHITVYKTWGPVTGKPVAYIQNKIQKKIQKPTFTENLLFFLKYQVGYMYGRYFGWNFIGRQNNIDGDGGILYGNCISGIRCIDSFFYGPQDKLPDRMKKNKGRNTYFFLPFLFGVVGAIYQFRKNKQHFAVVGLLFVMTGLAIILYLNQTPLQVRERDYAYAGSFYAFSIWIGLGVLSFSGFIRKRTGKLNAGIIATILSFFAVPCLLAVENWDDHNRSGRYTAHDVAFNYLTTCAQDAILFTNGDNDTFPLWYLQEVEGIRTDVRIVNVLLLGYDWYIDQMKHKINGSDPLPIYLSADKYRAGICDFVYLSDADTAYMDIRDAIGFISGTNSNNAIHLKSGEVLGCLPTRQFSIKVDTPAIFSNHTVSVNMRNLVNAEIHLKMNSEYISKSDLMIMDVLAHNHWQRPIYYISPDEEGSLGLRHYTQLEGFAYRFVPIYTKQEDLISYGRVESTILYNHLMNTFRWGQMNHKNVLIDDQNVQMASILKIRVNFSRLAEQLYLEGKKDSAKHVIARCMELMPVYNYPHDFYSLTLAEAAYQVKAIAQANQIVQEYANQCFQDLKFYKAMPVRLSPMVENEEIQASLTIQKLMKMAEKYGQKHLTEGWNPSSK